MKKLGVSGRSNGSQTGWPTIFSPWASSEWVFLAMYMKLVYGIGATRRGDVLAVFLENRPEYVGLLLGLSKVLLAIKYMLKCIFTNIFTTQIGVTAALINSNLRLGSLTHCITVGRCKVLYK